MKDRLKELLDQREVLYGLVCRDLTEADLEMLARVGYNVIWVDLEHGPMCTAEAIRLCHTITHLGMVPLARIIELTRSQVQSLLDGGFQIINLPNVAGARGAERLVELGKFPPLGKRGASSTPALTGYTLGDDRLRALSEANETTRLMVQIEDNAAFDELDSILRVDGIGMVTAGPFDWSLSLGVGLEQAKGVLAPRIDRIFSATREAGKIPVAAGVADVEQARHYRDLGGRIMFTGVDLTLKRNAFAQSLARVRDELG